MPTTRLEEPLMIDSEPRFEAREASRPERGNDAPQERVASADTLLIRPISPDDRQRLADGFQRLGERSRYRRFLSPREHLSEAELRYFTDVDHHNHEALIAIDPNNDEGVGVARYIRSKSEPSAAEVAVAVVDDWQGKGRRRSLGRRACRSSARRGNHQLHRARARRQSADAQPATRSWTGARRAQRTRHRRADGRSTRDRLGALAAAVSSGRARRYQSPRPCTNGVPGARAREPDRATGARWARIDYRMTA